MSTIAMNTARSEEEMLRLQNASIVSIHAGDIVKLSVDAIVNPTNQELLPGGGLSYHIHSSAGNQLEEECRRLRKCFEGEAKITRGYNLPAKYVIHTVGSRSQDKYALATCYRRCLELAEAYRLRTVAFPCISTGAFMFDHELACKVALRTVRAYLLMNHAMGKNSFDKIIFSTYSSADQKFYQALMPVYFPGHNGNLTNNPY